MSNNMPTTKTPLQIDSRFVVEAWANSQNSYVYSLYVNGQYISCLGIDGASNEHGVNERYTLKNAVADASKFATDILKRLDSGNPYKRGEKGFATGFLIN